jgi:hypothetical protein
VFERITMNRIVVVLAMMLVAVTSLTHADSNYQTVKNWAKFPPEVTTWSAATGVDIDPQGNIYVFHRNEAMPIMSRTLAELQVLHLEEGDIYKRWIFW